MLKSLAKSHAYALVGCSQGATAILQSARQKPGLSNFVVVRTPFNTGSDVHQFSGLLHPTLVFADGCAKGKHRTLSTAFAGCPARSHRS